MNKVFPVNLYSSEELHAFCGHFISAFYIAIKFFSLNCVLNWFSSITLFFFFFWISLHNAIPGDRLDSPFIYLLINLSKSKRILNSLKPKQVVSIECFRRLELFHYCSSNGNVMS